MYFHQAHVFLLFHIFPLASAPQFRRRTLFMPEPLKMWYEKDAPIDGLKGKTVAVLGYGSQGHAHAQNLRESGVKVIVANRRDSANGKLAISHGFEPMSVPDAVKQADLIIVTLPDELQPEIYNR